MIAATATRCLPNSSRVYTIIINEQIRSIWNRQGPQLKIQNAEGVVDRETFKIVSTATGTSDLDTFREQCDVTGNRRNDYFMPSTLRYVRKADYDNSTPVSLSLSLSLPLVSLEFRETSFATRI